MAQNQKISHEDYVAGYNDWLFNWLITHGEDWIVYELGQDAGYNAKAASMGHLRFEQKQFATKNGPLTIRYTDTKVKLSRAGMDYLKILARNE